MTFFKNVAVISAAYCGFSYIAGMIIYLYFLEYNKADSAIAEFAIINANPVLVHLTTLHTYILFSFGIIFFTTYLYFKLQNKQPALALLGLITSIIWSTLVIASGFIFMALTNIIASGTELAIHENSWQTIDIIRDALGGGNELLGGLFTGLLTLALHTARMSTKTTTVTGLIVFVGGTISVLPYMADIGIGIFVFSQIIWFFIVARDISTNT